MTERRLFQWLQEGDVRQAGDYTVSSWTGEMWTMGASMVGVPIKRHDMPVLRPVPPITLKPLDPLRDTMISTDPTFRYHGVPSHVGAPTPGTFSFPPLLTINEAETGLMSRIAWDVLVTFMISAALGLAYCLATRHHG